MLTLILLSGVEFTLLENGDVLWSYSDNFERLPLLDCDTYELMRERDGFTVEILLRLGAWKGQSHCQYQGELEGG